MKDGTAFIGNQAKVKVVKNKVAAPFKSCVIDIIFGKGISKSGEVVDLAAELDIIKKSGAWYAYKDQKIGQGRENTKKYLEDNPDLFRELTELVRERLNIN
jgi:recombination protein RecA